MTNEYTLEQRLDFALARLSDVVGDLEAISDEIVAASPKPKLRKADLDGIYGSAEALHQLYRSLTPR